MNTIRIEQIVEIPAGHRLTIDVPREIPAGRTILSFTPVPAVAEQTETSSRPEIEGVDKAWGRSSGSCMTAREAIEKCRGIAKGSRFTSERLFEYRREDAGMEEAEYGRDYRKEGD